MAKGYRNTLFTKVKTPNVPLNKFDLSYENLLSSGMGKLYPVLCKEMLPGDRFRVKSDVLIRVMPMTSPVYGNLKAYIHYFFVPNRLIWSNWEEFITGGPNGEDTHVPPYTTLGNLLQDSITRDGESIGDSDPEIMSKLSYLQGTLIALPVSTCVQEIFEFSPLHIPLFVTKFKIPPLPFSSPANQF